MNYEYMLDKCSFSEMCMCNIYCFRGRLIFAGFVVGIQSAKTARRKDQKESDFNKELKGKTINPRK